MSESAPLCVHATCVDVNGKGLLIEGASGTGKSALALELMCRGAELVSDDRVLLSCDGASVAATAPAAIRGMIEARNLGILRADPCVSTRICAIVNMNRVEQNRLPEHVEKEILGVSFPMLFRVDSPHFPAALIQYLKGGGVLPNG